jgi:hypothetical protein
MRLVSGARYDALDFRYQHACEKREEAEKTAAERLALITRQAAELAYFHDQHPNAPLPYPAPVQGDAELRRQLRLAREALAALDARRLELQKENEEQARELRALRKAGETP